jgi:hypothetical protein
MGVYNNLASNRNVSDEVLSLDLQVGHVQNLFLWRRQCDLTTILPAFSAQSRDKNIDVAV